MTDFRINVIVDPKGAAAGARTVERELTSLEDRGKSLGQTLQRAFGFLAAGALIKSSIGLLAEFEQEMSSVGAVIGATQAEMAALTAEAERLGTTTRYSASQAAEGMGLLARAGFNAREVLESIDDTLLLAQAGALGLGQAADITSSVLRGFRLETDQAGRVVDVLAKAANSSNADVSQLGDAMRFVAPVAAGLGVSLEETTAAVSALSNAGLQASLAGTGLRRVLSELESPSQKTRELLAAVGLTADDVKVSQVGLTAAMQALSKAGVDTGLALEIFGDRGGPAFEVLASSIPDVQRMTQEMKDAEGSAKEVADAMDDNLNGALLKVRASFQGVILALGKAGATDALQNSMLGLAGALTTVAENMDVLVTAVVAGGAAFAALKIVPLIAGFVELQAAVSAGEAVILGSATATEIQAAANVHAAAAQVAATQAKLAAIETEIVWNGGMLTANTSLAAQAVLQEQNAAASLALAEAQTALASASTAAALETTFLGRAFTQLKAVIAAHPIGAVAVAVGALAAAFVALIPETETATEKTKRFRGSLIDLTGTVERIQDLRAQKEVLTSVGGTADEFAANARSQLQAIEDAAAALVKKGQEGAASIDLGDLIKIAPDVPQDVVDKLIKQGQDARDKALAALENTPATDQGFFDSLFGIDTAEVNKTAVQAVQGNVAIADALKLVTDAAIEQRKALADLDNEKPNDKLRVAALSEVRTALDNETALLGLNEHARDRANHQLDIERDLREKGVLLTKEEQGALTQRLVQIQALADTAAVYANIKGPQEDYARTVAILNNLLASNSITTQEYAVAVRDAESALGGIAEIQRTLTIDLQAERDLLGATAAQRQIANEVMRAESDLRRELTDDEKAQIEAITAEKIALEDQAAVLAEIRGPAEQLARTQAALKALFDKSAISAEEYSRALLDAKVAAGDLTHTAQGGLLQGLDMVRQKLNDTSGQLSGLMVDAFSHAEDAMVKFLTTGELGFSEFVNSITADLARLLAQKALASLANSIAGAAGGASGYGAILSGLFGGAKASGGDVAPGMAYLVGENGPELFTPPQAGTIVPAGETAAMMAAGQKQEAPVVNTKVEVNPNIINVTDPAEVASYINSGAADEAIVNRISRNPRAFRSAMGVAS